MRGGFCKKAAANDMTSAAARSGQRGSNSLTAIPRMAVAIRRSPGSPRIRSRLRRGVEAARSAGLLCHSKKKDTTCRRVLLFGAGNEARTRLPPSREWLAAIRGSPGSPRIGSRLRRGVEAASSLGFSVIPKRKDTTCRRVLLFGAGNEARTRYLHLGKVALYQMSYARGTRGILTEKHPLVKPLLQDFLRSRRQRPLHPRPPAADP